MLLCNSSATRAHYRESTHSHVLLRCVFLSQLFSRIITPHFSLASSGEWILVLPKTKTSPQLITFCLRSTNSHSDEVSSNQKFRNTCRSCTDSNKLSHSEFSQTHVHVRMQRIPQQQRYVCLTKLCKEATFLANMPFISQTSSVIVGLM